MQSVSSVPRLGFSLQFWLYFTKSGCLVASERSFLSDWWESLFF